MGNMGNDGTCGLRTDEVLLEALESPDYHLHVWRLLLDFDLAKLQATTDAERRAELQESIAEAEGCISTLLVEREARERRKTFRLVVGNRSTR
jgi:hypothetical protein